MTYSRICIPIVSIIAAAGFVQGGVSKAVQKEYQQRLEGKDVELKMDLKVLEVVMTDAGKTLEGQSSRQRMDATEMTSKGVVYADPERGTLQTYAVAGSILQVESVKFKSSGVKIRLRQRGLDESATLTLTFDKEADAELSEQHELDAMLAAAFVVRE